MCSDCEAYGSKKHRLMRSDCALIHYTGCKVVSKIQSLSLLIFSFLDMALFCECDLLGHWSSRSC